MISIIIPIYNTGNCLEQFLADFFKVNTCNPVELLLLDFVSSKTVSEMADRYAVKGLLRYIPSGNSTTFVTACNRAARMARYDTLLFSSETIVYTHDVLPEMLATLDNPAVGVVSVKIVEDPRIAATGKVPSVKNAGIHFVWNQQRGYFQPEPITYSNTLPHAVTRDFLCCRKADFLAIDGFNDAFNGCLEDIDPVDIDLAGIDLVGIDWCLRMETGLNKKCVCLTGTSLEQAAVDSTKSTGIRDNTRQAEQNHRIFKNRWDNYIRGLIGQPPVEKSERSGTGIFSGSSPQFYKMLNVLIDPDWYRRRYGKMIGAGVFPVDHYMAAGWKKGMMPNPFFDTGWYLECYRDVAESGLNPLVHYIQKGWKEGKNPSEFFETRFYLDRYPDVVKKGVNPLYHFIKSGFRENRIPSSRFRLVNTLTVPGKSLLYYVHHYKTTLESLSISKFPQRPLTVNEEKYLPTPAVVIPRNAWELAAGNQEKSGNKIAVFSVNVGNRDIMYTPMDIPGVDYYVFTDRLHEPAGGWNFLPLDYSENDPKRTSLYYKTHPHRYFTGYDLVIWCDMNIRMICKNLTKLYDFNQGHKLASYVHWCRDCLYAEADAVVKSGRDLARVVEKQTARYRKEGFPEKYGLFETNVIFQKHLEPDIIRLNSTWWKEIVQGSRRDQLSFTYALWKQKLECRFIEPAPVTARKSRHFEYLYHD